MKKRYKKAWGDKDKRLFLGLSNDNKTVAIGVKILDNIEGFYYVKIDDFLKFCYDVHKELKYPVCPKCKAQLYSFNQGLVGCWNCNNRVKPQYLDIKKLKEKKDVCKDRRIKPKRKPG